MDSKKAMQSIQKVNSLLTDLYNSLDNQEARSAVQAAYNKINKPDKISAKCKEVPEAVEKMKKVFSRLSLSKVSHLTRAQEELVSELTVFTRRSFQKGFDGLVYVDTWFI
ncbi:hypothetical protein E5340_11270 [Ligilactobacillus murinus]|uniref:Bacteriocin immunity protein n=1 Tax=Ligilactobacillus murinus TaxID=1622 RepID=A0A4S2E8J7_9LACO|nr:hypothetical protein [Ligilactobacillus murinus]TGY51665.1 hypothetical protein E5340_11270 [Ligilactobacillus murinus]